MSSSNDHRHTNWKLFQLPHLLQQIVYHLLFSNNQLLRVFYSCKFQYLFMHSRMVFSLFTNLLPFNVQPECFCCPTFLCDFSLHSSIFVLAVLVLLLLSTNCRISCIIYLFFIISVIYDIISVAAYSTPSAFALLIYTAYVFCSIAYVLHSNSISYSFPNLPEVPSYLTGHFFAPLISSALLTKF